MSNSIFSNTKFSSKKDFAILLRTNFKITRYLFNLKFNIKAMKSKQLITVNSIHTQELSIKQFNTLVYYTDFFHQTTFPHTFTCSQLFLVFPHKQCRAIEVIQKEVNPTTQNRNRFSIHKSANVFCIPDVELEQVNKAGQQRLFSKFFMSFTILNSDAKQTKNEFIFVM